MLYQCPDCTFKTEWSERDFADRGEPVCPHDDADMEPAPEQCKHVWKKHAKDVYWCKKCEATRDSDGGIIN